MSVKNSPKNIDECIDSLCKRCQKKLQERNEDLEESQRHLFGQTNNFQKQENNAQIQNQPNNPNTHPNLTDNNSNDSEGIIAFKNKERSLSDEVGGLETNYDKIRKKIHESIDEWDIPEDVVDITDSNTSLSSAYKSFIHKKKKGKGRTPKKLGSMTLGEQNLDSLNYMEKIKKMRDNKSRNNSGNGISM